MLNTMCNDCSKRGRNCAGTECQTWAGCIMKKTRVYVLQDFITGKDYYTRDRERAERAAAENGLFLDYVDMSPAEAIRICGSCIIEPLTVQISAI